MENELNQIVKPITVAKNEFKNSIIGLINEFGLPLFVTGYVLQDILNQVLQQSQQQELIEEQEYKKSLAETNEKNEKEK